MRADVSITIREALARNAVFTVSEYLVFWAGILCRQRVHPPEQIFDLAGQNMSPSLCSEAFPAFL